MKKIFLLVTAFIFTLVLNPVGSFAEMGGGCGKGHGSKPGMQEMFFKKVKLIYTHQEELKITDKQLEQIKEVKLALKKDLIKKEADIEILGIDIHSLLYQEDVDLVAVNNLIDQKYEIKKEKTKKIVASYAQLKKILSKDQRGQIKELLKDSGKMRHGKEMHKGRKM